MRHRIAIFLALSAFLLTVHARAGTYHVRPEGSDKADGSPARPWKTISRALAVTARDAELTLVLAPGVHDLGPAEVPLRSRLTLRGAGPEKTTVVGALRGTGVRDITITGLTLAGTADRKAPRRNALAIDLLDGSDLTLRDVLITGFTGGALRLERWERATVEDCRLIDTTYNSYKLDGKTPATMTSAVLLGDISEVAIRRCIIDTTAAGGRGIGTARRGWSKTPWADPPALLRRLEISDCAILVDQWHAWNVPDTTNHPPQMTIELWHACSEEVVIEYCLLNNNISLSSDRDPKRPPVERTIRVHHNRFELTPPGAGYRYACETYVDRLEFDHNVIIGGVYPLANFNKNATFPDARIHHNVFHATGNPGALINLASAMPGLLFANNTVYLTRAQDGPMVNFGNPEDKNPGQRFVNNLFVSAVPQKQGLGATVGVSHNAFWQIPPSGEKAILGNPRLPADGDVPSPAMLLPDAKSLAVDAGVVVKGITEGHAGKAPDLGAFEFGTKPWRAGPRPRPATRPAAPLAPLTPLTPLTPATRAATTRATAFSPDPAR